MSEPTPTITVLVNGVAQTIGPCTLEQWVQAQDQLPGAVATALNGQFVARALRGQKLLTDGDAIVTFQPIEGG